MTSQIFGVEVDEFTKARFIVLGVIVFVGSLLLPYIHAPGTNAHILGMRKAINELPPPIMSVMLSEEVKAAWWIILLYRSYKSELTYDELKQYYQPLLEKAGWRFATETSLRDLGRDLGGRELLFCKPPYAADLQYIGRNADSGATFILSVSWRLNPVCNSKTD